MRDPASLSAAMEQARRERPAPLPVSFSGDLMKRLDQAQPAQSRTLPLPLAFAIACSVVLTASVVSIYPHLPEPQSQPPSLGIFRSPAAHAPFATP